MTDSSSRSIDSRQRLGRGLAALLGERRPEHQGDSSSSGTKLVPIEFIRPNSRNPRLLFEEAEMEELAASIKQFGIIQPILVRFVPGLDNTYEVVAGERRWRAAQRAGLHAVPIICLDVNDREALELSIVENVQRSNLNALEEARGYTQLASDYGYSHSDIGRVVGKSRSHIANTMRLLALPEHSQKLLSSGAISAGHARALLTSNDPDAIADQIVGRGLTVRDVERLNTPKPILEESEKLTKLDPNVNNIVRRISLALGVEAGIVNNKRSCLITIRCKNLEQAEAVFEKLMRS